MGFPVSPSIDSFIAVNQERDSITAIVSLRTSIRTINIAIGYCCTAIELWDVNSNSYRS